MRCPAAFLALGSGPQVGLADAMRASPAEESCYGGPSWCSHRQKTCLKCPIPIPRFYLAGAIKGSAGNRVGGFVVPVHPTLVVRPRGGGDDEVERVSLEQGTVVISIGSLFRMQSLAHTIHHEIFHVVQQKPAAARLLRGWASLNPEHSPYLDRSGQDFLENRSSYTAERCFITRYARSCETEDQAEVFAVLMTDPASAREQGVYDPCLGEKISRMGEVMNRLPEIFGLSDAAIR